MKVSIIIPVYNVAPYIVRCLDSVGAQSYSDIECILVDDCGADNSMEIARLWISKYMGPIRFLIVGHQENKGLSAARNTGIEVATGDYVYFLDSDDAITPDCIEILVGLAKKYPNADFVQGNTKHDKQEVMPHRFRINVPEYVEGRDMVDFTVLSATINTPWNRLLKRAFIVSNELLFPEGIVHEDNYWTYFLARHAKHVAYTNTGTYYYYVNGNSTINSSSKTILLKRIKGYRVCTSSFFSDLSKNGSTSKYQRRYFADTFVNYMLVLHSCHSIIQWHEFWMLMFKMAWKARRKVSCYRFLLLLCTLPPLCFLTKFQWYRWRLRHYIISKV